MITRFILTGSEKPSQEGVTEAVNILKAGGIIAVPTETVFGLACDGSNKNAVNRLYDIKRRPKSKDLVIQIADIARLSYHKAVFGNDIKGILNKFWPGPLTVILNTMHGPKGFRMPDNKTTLAVIRKSNFPIAVTSANISGRRSSLSAEEALSVFDGLIEAVINDGTKAFGTASTVLDCTIRPFRVLRQGPLSMSLKSFWKT
jgi:L-threonylcarbamoyladenylate synthase